jgi:hypothetical protein
MFRIQWEEPITVPVYSKGNEAECSSYRELSLLSTSYKTLFDILLSRFYTYVGKNIEDYQ